MTTHGDALLVTDPNNIRYLTGFIGGAPDEREAYLLWHGKTAYLFTNSLYKEQATALLAGAQTPLVNAIHFIEISRDSPIATELRHVIKKEHISTLGFEDTSLTVAELTRLKEVLADTMFTATRGRIEQLRMVKRPDELTCIKQAARITDQCFMYVAKRIRPGISENRLSWEIEGFIRAKGAELAFSPIVAFNEHSSVPHYQHRSRNPLRRNSLILLDFGAKIHGYCADMTRVVFLGTPKPQWTDAHAAVLQASRKAIDMLQNGQRNGATLDAAAREVIAEAGLPEYPHSLGHAVGLAIHEAPRLTVKKEEIIAPESIVTIEPATYVPGSFGIRIEDLLFIKKNSVEVLSTSPYGLTVH